MSYNNKIFEKIYLKIRVKGKEIIIYHFFATSMEYNGDMMGISWGYNDQK